MISFVCPKCGSVGNVVTRKVITLDTKCKPVYHNKELKLGTIGASRVVEGEGSNEVRCTSCGFSGSSDEWLYRASCVYCGETVYSGDKKGLLVFLTTNWCIDLRAIMCESCRKKRIGNFCDSCIFRKRHICNFGGV